MTGRPVLFSHRAHGCTSGQIVGRRCSSSASMRRHLVFRARPHYQSPKDEYEDGLASDPVAQIGGVAERWTKQKGVMGCLLTDSRRNRGRPPDAKPHVESVILRVAEMGQADVC